MTATKSPRFRHLGLELKVARITRGVRQREIAAEMHVSTRRISQIELTTFIGEDVAARYIDALARCGQ